MLFRWSAGGQSSIRMKRNVWARSLPCVSEYLCRWCSYTQSPLLKVPGCGGSQPIRAVKIILVGDSTMAVHSGWGGSFALFT